MCFFSTKAFFHSAGVPRAALGESGGECVGGHSTPTRLVTL